MNSSRATHAPNVRIRPYSVEDENEILKLLRTSLGEGPGGHRSPEFFRWKHMENPFGRSFMLVAESDARIVGLRAFMRWRFQAGKQGLIAVRAVDTATHPDYQGLGIFSALTRAALDALRHEVDFVFNTPNAKSLPGYLKMGWHTVGKAPIAIKVRRPARFAGGFRTVRTDDAGGSRPGVAAVGASEALDAPRTLARLLSESREDDERITTARDMDYLRWRYGQAPLLDYRAVVVGSPEQPKGLAIFRVRSRGSLWEATISELISRRGDTSTARQLLRRVAATARVDHLACSFTRGSTAARAATQLGYLRSPIGMTLVANPLRAPTIPDPTDMRSWATSLGDLEVF